MYRRSSLFTLALASLVMSASALAQPGLPSKPSIPSVPSIPSKPTVPTIPRQKPIPTQVPEPTTVTPTAQPAAASRGAAPTSLSLELEGLSPVHATSVDGGVLVGDLNNQAPLAVAGTHIEPLHVTLSAATVLDDNAWRDWLNAVLAGNAATRSGSVNMLKFDGSVAYALQVTGAAASGFALDTLDASAKDALDLHLTLQPASSKWVVSPSQGAKPAVGAKLKRPLASNFRVSIDGLPTQRISKVEGIGAARQPSGAWLPGVVKITLSAADAAQYIAWHEELAKSGHASDKSLTVDILDPALKESLLTIKADRCSILSARINSGGPRESVATLEIELFVSGWQIK